MTEGPVKKPMPLLYITLLDLSAGDKLLAASSRINIGMLSHDFDVSVAVVGPVTTVALNRLRIDLGPTRITGAFEPSKTDRPVDRPLRALSRQLLGSDMVSARLQAAIQRKAEDFPVVIVDHVLAWSYRPATVAGAVYFTPREWFVENRPPSNHWWSRWATSKIAAYELAISAAADTIITRSELASKLSEQGVTMKKLRPSFSKPAGSQPSIEEVAFTRTANRIGYIGYLGDDKNNASLVWFLDNVWSVITRTLPDVELHIIGTAPNETLQFRLAQFSNVVLHWGGSDALLFKMNCRVVVDPLLYEIHADSKLINAMARGIPTVTTCRGLSRSRVDIGKGVTAADTPEGMVLAIKALMTDGQIWKRAADMAASIARPQLADFEVAHAIRRELVRSASVQSGADQTTA